jgi:hypothetical protein
MGCTCSPGVDCAFVQPVSLMVCNVNVLQAEARTFDSYHDKYWIQFIFCYVIVAFIITLYIVARLISHYKLFASGKSGNESNAWWSDGTFLRIAITTFVTNEYYVGRMYMNLLFINIVFR